MYLDTLVVIIVSYTEKQAPISIIISFLCMCSILFEFLTLNKLEIMSCISNGGLSLPNATMHSVKSTVDVLNLMKTGDLNRAVGSTAINNRSSRSHRSVSKSDLWLLLIIVLNCIKKNLFFHWKIGEKYGTYKISECKV